MHQNKRIIMWLNDQYGEGNENVKTVIETLGRDIPKKIVSLCKIDNVIGGYCPNCNGTVRIEETWLVKTKGQHCSWCGQKLDWSEV